MHFSVTELLNFSHADSSRFMVVKSTVQGNCVMVAQLVFSFDALDFQSRKLDLNVMNC